MDVSTITICYVQYTVLCMGTNGGRECALDIGDAWLVLGEIEAHPDILRVVADLMLYKGNVNAV